MTTVSASPARLASFAEVWRTRAAAVDEQASLSGLGSAVVAGCPGRAVEVPALGALTMVLDHMATNESFVATVRSAVERADVITGGIATIDTAVVDAALERAGHADASPLPVEFDAATREVVAPTSGMIDDPINASNGNMVHHELDVEFPAIAAALNLERTWNSLLASEPGAFGQGWSSVLDVALDVAPSKVVASLADGNVVAFVPWRDGWAAPGVPRLRLVALDAGWALHVDPYRRFLFDADGRLTGWEAGVARVAAERDVSGRITALTESVTGRSLRIGWAAGVVSELSAGEGRFVRYSRDGAGRIRGVRSDSGSVEYRWDGDFLVAAVDADGVAAFVNTYDDDGRVLSQLSPFGRLSTYRYDDTGLTVFSDAAGVVQAMRHDRFGNLTTVIDVDGSAMRLDYDDARRVVRVVERDQATWRYCYDGDDLAERVDPDGLSQRWVWDEHHRLVESVDRSGGVTRYEYDTAHRAPSRVTGPDGSVTSQRLDERGLPVEIVDADGVVTTLRWDRDGQLAATADAFGETTTFEYDSHGRLRAIAPPWGASTVLDHDEHGRVVRTQRGDAVWQYGYTAAGRVCRGVEPGDVAWSATFGSHGAIESLTDAAGATATFGYDAIGNVTAVTAPDGAVYRHVFDEVGRLVAAIEPTGATTATVYDRRGRAVEVSDARGSVWRRRIDVLGRTVASTAPDGAEASYTYHPEGHIASITGSDGRVWLREFDEVGRPVAVVSPTGDRAVIEYTPAGRVRRRTSPAGQREQFEYDAAGRLAAVLGVDGLRRSIGRDPRGWVASVLEHDVDGVRRVDHRWDDNGHLVGLVAGRQEWMLRRDAAGRVVESVDPTGVVTRFEWDARGLLAAATDPAGLATRYEHDARGRLVELETPGGRSTRIGYGLDGLAETVTDPAGVVTRFLRDAAGTVTGVRHADGTGWNRRLDPVGREIERVGTDGTVAGRFEYDAAGRILAATVPDSGVTVGFLWDDEHGDERVPRTDLPRDRAGRLTVGPDGTVFRYDDVGRIAEISPPDERATTFTYGGDGLVATERGPAGVRRYHYDPAGRVVTMDVEGIGATTYSYDACGRRAREDRPGGTAVVYRWDAFGRLERIDQIDALGVATTTIDVAYDALDRPALVGGEPPDERPWVPGGDRPFGGTPAGDVWIIGARVLDPDTHQFLSSDPLLPVPGSHGAASGYTYCWNDPINWVDPTGMRPLSVDEFNDLMSAEERTTFGKAWDAVKEDPWGSLAMVGVTALGVGLCATGVGTVVGAGILVGVGASAGIGLATGTFDPRMVAVNGVVGGLSAGLGGALTTTTWQGAVALGAGTGAGETVVGSLLAGQGFPTGIELAVGTGTGGLVSGGASALRTVQTPGATAVLDHAPTSTGTTTADNFVDLASPARRAHILVGDAAGGGHLWPGLSGKTPFPQSWSGDRIMHEVSDIATDPAAWQRGVAQGSRTVLTGVRDDVEIRVIVGTSTGEIVSGYPINLPRNP
jgi:RHS repeat-associated protein